MNAPHKCHGPGDRHLVALITGILILVFWPVATRGADESGEPHDRSASPPLSIDFSVERVGRAGIDGTGSSIAFIEYSAGMGWQFLLLDLDRRENVSRAGTGLAGATGREPWGSLTRVAPGLQYYREVNERWGLWAKLVAIAGFEDRFSSRSWTYNPQLIGFHMPREQLTLYAGFGSLYHPVDKTVYPVLGVTWNMDSHIGPSGALGFPETMLRYHFNEQLAVKVDFQWDIRVYSLAEDNRLAPNGSMRVEELKPGLHLECFPTASLRVTTGVRRFMGRNLTFFSRTESELATYDINDSWSFLFDMEYMFEGL